MARRGWRMSWGGRVRRRRVRGTRQKNGVFRKPAAACVTHRPAAACFTHPTFDSPVGEAAGADAVGEEAVTRAKVAAAGGGVREIELARREGHAIEPQQVIAGAER